MTVKSIRIGGASGYWGESDIATPQLLEGGKLDYLVFDYLAEITMSIMARARASDPNKGYALDFVTAVLKPHLPQIASQGIKVISNAGGVNPQACGDAIAALVSELGLDLKVAVVTGDDVLAPLAAGTMTLPTEMFNGAPPPPADKLMSANAYLGAFPIAHALDQGADIIVTGRCVDSAVTLGACIHAFGWQADAWDQLSGGSLAGHVIECGPQCCGGNFTDWRDVPDMAHAGYPIAEISNDGSFTISKAQGTGGLISVGTVSEQIIYEIGDPQAYMLPDVVCDFANIVVEQAGDNLVRVSGAKGHPAPDTYKCSVTYQDGFKGSMQLTFAGYEAEEKFRAYIDGALTRTREKLSAKNVPDFEEISLEVLGTESQYGSAAQVPSGAREIVGKIGVKHVDAAAVGAFFKEIMGYALATPAGLCGFGGGRPKPTPVVRLFSCVIPKQALNVSIDLGSGAQSIATAPGARFDPASLPRPADPAVAASGDTTTVPLIKLAWGRSGDKGDKANIGIIARKADYLPYIANALSAAAVDERFSHFLDGKGDGRVERFVMPGMNALNFLLHEALGGGGIASLRNDPQAKSYAQILLDFPISIPTHLAEQIK